MSTLQRSALLPYAADALYALVCDIESYPSFLPGCVAATVEAREDTARPPYVRARLGFRLKGLSDSFVTENRLTPGERIDMAMVEGPFKRLSGSWEFKPLRADACKVLLQLDLDLGSRVLVATLGPWLQHGATQTIDAFTRRAREVLGGG